MATPNPTPSTPGYDDAELVEALGAEVGGEYHALEVAMIAAVVVELRSRPGDPGASVRLRREGARLAAEVDARRLSATAVAAAARSGAQAAATEVGVRGTGRVRVSARIIRETDTLAREMGDTLAPLAPRMAAWMPRAYSRASSMLTSSTQDDQRAIASRYLAKGIPGKLYSNGAWMPIGSYAEMVARTITHQASIVARTLTMTEAEVNLCSIVTAFDACATCAQNRGKVWSLDGTPAGLHSFRSVSDGSLVVVDVAGPLADASSGSHFRGPNCRCQVVSAMPGLSVPVGSPHNPAAERERDRQRALERDIRRWKYRELAALDDTEKALARRRVRASQGRLREFLDSTGRQRRTYREQVAWSMGERRVKVPAPVSVIP